MWPILLIVQFPLSVFPRMITNVIEGRVCSLTWLCLALTGVFPDFNQACWRFFMFTRNRKAGNSLFCRHFLRCQLFRLRTEICAWKTRFSGTLTCCCVHFHLVSWKNRKWLMAIITGTIKCKRLQSRMSHLIFHPIPLAVYDIIVEVAHVFYPSVFLRWLARQAQARPRWFRTFTRVLDFVVYLLLKFSALIGDLRGRTLSLSVNGSVSYTSQVLCSVKWHGWFALTVFSDALDSKCDCSREHFIWQGIW